MARLFLLLLLPVWSVAQIVPTTGAVECFQAGSGAIFTDIGGLGGNPTVEGAPGNYPNCDCVTTTTLCSPDGSAVTANFTSFGVFASFDWLVILDGDNPDNEVYPYSILDDPANLTVQLFNNTDGAGDGGAENYGVGAEIGAGTLAELPTTTYSASNPTGCLTFVFRASAVVDDPGWEALISTGSGIAHPGDGIPCDQDISCFPPSNVQIVGVTGSTGEVTWTASPDTDNYIIEYGPSGFSPGTGTTVMVTGTSFTIEGLDENTMYDVYIQADCGGGDLSALIGPYEFMTGFINPPTVCTYTLLLEDSFGDGWNGASLDVTINGITTNYTFFTGNQASFSFDVLDGLPLVLEYFSGVFENEVTYTLFNSDGNPIFSDGPFPQTGVVYDELAVCPDCLAPSASSITATFIGVDSAVIDWDPLPSAEQYQLEWAPAGFPLGFGLTSIVDGPPASLSGLNPCVNYDVYVYAICGEDSLSAPAGPLTFQTQPESVGDPCTYTIEMFDSFGDGWNNANITVTINGVSTVYTFTTGFEATFNLNVFANLPMIFTYSPGVFENEVSFNIIDPDGNVIYSDGPFPQTGQILSIVACPTCSGPLSFDVTDVNATSASFVWSAATDPGSYTLEYGPLGFTLGTGTVLNPTGTSATITGLSEGSYYDVYLSFLCDDGEKAKTLGPITIHTIWLNDVGVSGLISPTLADCNLGSEETISIQLENFGQNPQSLVPFFYAVNGVPANISLPADGLYTGVLGNDSTDVVEFDLTYDFSVPGYYLIEAWTALDPDSDRSNDTFRIEIITASPLPLMEDFESGVFPAGWTSDEFNPMYGPNNHNNPTWVIADNNYSFDQQFLVTTHRVGPLGDNDSLYFDYRFVNWFAGTTATTLNGDSLNVYISDDCEETFTRVFTIDQFNHTPTTNFTTVGVDLSTYANKAINVRFEQKWAVSGDYWTDLDNINVTGCPAFFLFDANIVDATGSDKSDGSISLTGNVLGTGPFTFEWEDLPPDSSVNVLTGLLPGNYLVTITDAMGCTEQRVITVGVSTGTIEAPFLDRFDLFPNPTNGSAVIDLVLQETSDLRLQVYNSVGQLLVDLEEDGVRQLRREIDLGQYPAGMYFVKVAVEDQWHLAKLILAK